MVEERQMYRARTRARGKIVGEKVGIGTRRREGMGVTKGRRSGDEKAARVRAVWVQLMFHRCKLPVLLFSRM